LQNLLTTMRWDDTAVNRTRVHRMCALPTDGDGVLVLDDTGFAKKGTASVGVARQYTGTTGKVDHCQVAVTCVYAERTVSWPVSARLYLPQSWADDADRHPSKSSSSRPLQDHFTPTHAHFTPTHAHLTRTSRIACTPLTPGQ
jgi:SRSO17 transposase